MGQVELLSPAGDFETALAAFAAGADAVYCGLSDFSARAFAKNLSPDDLRNLVAYARSQNAPRRVYVAFNTLLDESQLESAVESLATLDDIGPDALIVQDLGVARICRKYFPSLELHASTQLVVHNLEGVLALKELGFRRVVLSRELSLEEVSLVARRCGAMKMMDDGRPEMELECFIHGALCYSISGLCLFGAMEKGRSGNRGTCPYCCRQGVMGTEGVNGRDDGGRVYYPFSMKDLRLGEDARKLADAGVSSLKIEGRMKSALYVASVTRYYRQILDGAVEKSHAKFVDAGQLDERQKGKDVTEEDLETVFSRKTTELYFSGRPSGRGAVGDSPIDPVSLGHQGAFIGTVKRVMKDRSGRRWLCFHTLRALEKHDGLQFDAVNAEGRHLGLGISEMSAANPHRTAFAVKAGTDVEVLLPDAGPDDGARDQWSALRPGTKIFCSMSNAVKRMFPAPSFRPSDCEGVRAVDLEVELRRDGISCRATAPYAVSASQSISLEPAKTPERTQEAVRKAFSKLGGTGYRLGSLTTVDPDGLFAPMGALNAVRREIVERLDEARADARHAKVAAALGSVGELPKSAADGASPVLRTLKVRPGQKIPQGEWDEIVVAVLPEDFESADVKSLGERGNVRLALPVYTAEPDFNRMRMFAKRMLREGCSKWEASDLATLRLLKSLGVTDITADWSLAAFNSAALAKLSEAGVRRFVASPENSKSNLQALAESGFAVEFLSQQSTPLFISLTKPETEPESLGGGLTFFRRGGLWITTRDVPRTFDVPRGHPSRIDLSWDPDRALDALCRGSPDHRANGSVTFRPKVA